MQTRGLLVAGVLLLIAAMFCGGFAVFNLRDAQAWEADLQAAKQRWEAHGPSSYRMVLEEASCVTDYLVRSGRVIWGYETPCGRYGRTVPSLFSLIQEYQRSHSECYGPACRCQRVTTLAVRYDAQLGFPEQIAIQMREWPNWQSSAFWQAVVASRANPCTQSGAWMITVQGLSAE